ncbi:DUF3617 domain-containing protein [Sphingomonas sp. HDW15A]|uniref:DUF3617 domain-containing protein n=1 Tax=Sphingomonas sp. HDW15A TaxID=2714942 RepID=UPI00140996B3|nr:DUF3617 domain-containing protein [Sphingomonas sp. HDW15A]QIK96729.1 DUF3617 domain-containing protein [Sphingomonas sp. HDW15A]
MMMRRLALWVSLLLLSACDRGAEVSVENATPEEVAAEMKKSGVAQDLRKPGQWSTSMAVAQIEAPGMPPEALNQMRAMMGNGQTTERCVTAEELKQVDSFIGQNNANCRFEHYRVSGGKIDGKAKCTQGAVNQTMTMNGSFTENSSDMTIRSETAGGPPGQNMTVTMNIKSKRLGECKPDNAAQR